MQGLAQRLVLKQRQKETFIHELLTGAFDYMQALLRRLRKEPEVLDEYDSIIREQLSSGVIEKVTELEESTIYLIRPSSAETQQPRSCGLSTTPRQKKIRVELL